MCIGISIGMAIGSAMDNIPLWMCIGLSIGIGAGNLIDSAVNAKNKENSEKSENTTEMDDEKTE
jgi:F0F1-type ATP synthase assembly protein I